MFNSRTLVSAYTVIPIDNGHSGTVVEYGHLVRRKACTPIDVNGSGGKGLYRPLAPKYCGRPFLSMAKLQNATYAPFAQ